jgi:hypothetical protein
MPWMFELWKLQKRRRQIKNRHYKFDPKKNAPIMIGEFLEERNRDLADVQQRIDDYTADQLLKEAEKYDVQLPAIDPPELYFTYVRTAAYRIEARKLIDDEKTRRREVRGWWWKNVIVPGLAAATGLVGAITGLIAIIYGKK